MKTTIRSALPTSLFAATTTLAALAALAACGDIDVFVPLPVFGGPQGVLQGTVTYSGPAPCTENGHIVGAVVLLAFDTRLLPPPEGLGTTATSVAVVAGESFFAGLRNTLPFLPDGKRLCPDPGSAPVTVSAPWTLGPLPAASYQVRGFYDIDGDFDPGFGINNLPSQGDVGGGAIENAAEVLLGAAPRYREVLLGTPEGTIPEEGALVDGIAVTLGLTLPLERPIFHAKAVLDEYEGNTDPSAVVMPSDFQLELFSATNPASEKSFIRYVLGAGVAPEEIDTVKAAPFGFPIDESEPCFIGSDFKKPCLVYSVQDANGDGKGDPIPESVGQAIQVKSLFPIAIFNKLQSGKKIGAQSAPVVLLQGVTVKDSLTNTALAPDDLLEPSSEILVGLRPSVVCMDPADPKAKGTILVTHDTDRKGSTLVGDPEALKGALAAQFGREFDLVYGCLPEGEYAMNLIYETGQAWTIPNEAGVCASTEEVVGTTQCGKRARVASQGTTLRIGPPADAAYCAAHPTPATCLAK